MKIKNINPVERHIEKITLAVAAAAAVYLGYLSISVPVTVPKGGPGSEEVPANQIEQVVSAATGRLKADMDKAQANPPKANPVEYVSRYQSQQTSPLSRDLLGTLQPFVPLSVSATGSNQLPQQQTVAKMTPTIPPVEAVRAVPSHGLIIPTIKSAVAPAVAAAASQPAAIDSNWVKIEGSFPMLQMRENYASLDDPAAALPLLAQRITVYRLEVQREEKLPTGEWSPWKTIPPIKTPKLLDVTTTMLDDSNNKQTLQYLDDNVTNILMPPFYQIIPTQTEPGAVVAPQPAHTGPTPAEIKAREDRIKKAQDDAARRAGSAVPAGGGRFGPPMGPGGGGGPPPMYLQPGGGVSPVRPTTPVTPSGATPIPMGGGGPPIMGGGGPPYMGPPGTGGGPPMMGATDDATRLNQTVAALQALASFPIWFWDENVQPEHDYKYRVRLVMYNPTYHYPTALKDPKMKDEPWLTSEWVEVTGEVHIEASQQFFLSRGIGDNTSVAVKIYERNAGRIVMDEQTISPGVTIGHLRTSDNIDFTTGYLVVDVQARGNNDTVVILLSPNGQLVTRDLQNDLKDPRRTNLDEKYHRALPAPGAVTPTAAGGSGPPPAVSPIP